MSNFTFTSDGSPAGDTAVKAMQAVCDQDYASLKAIFNKGDVSGLPFTVFTDATGGAYHNSCADTGIHVQPSDAPSLLVAEVVECFEAQGGAVDCGFTAGEGLSRALAMAVRPFQVQPNVDWLGDPQGWWNNGNPTDYFNDNSNDDTNESANACATLGWFWLVSQQAFSWQQAVNTGKSTMGDIAAALLNVTPQAAFGMFVGDLKKFQASDGSLSLPNSGDPFPISNPTPKPTPGPQGCNFLARFFQ